MEDDTLDNYLFIVSAISDRSLETFYENVAAADVLEALVKFLEMWPLASITSIQKA